MGRLGHVPEHEVRHPGFRWVVRAGALLLGVLAVSVAFIASYVGALHAPQPHDVPVAVVSSDVNAQALLSSIGQQPSRLAARSYPTSADADRALDERAVYAVLRSDPVTSGLALTVAGGAAPGVADLITQTLAQAAGAAQIPIAVRDAHPPAAGDPRGLTPFYLVLGWLLGGYLAATALAVILGTVPRNLARLGMRLGAFAVFAALLGLAGVLVTNWGYDIWTQHTVALWLAGTLIVFAGAALTAALEGWVGLIGTGLAMLVLFILGNPGSGGVYPPEFLPAFFRDLHRWLPTGQATELVRAIEYFAGRAIGWQLTGLMSYAALGLVVLFGATVTLGHRHSAPESGDAAHRVTR
jgi:hypothetical protein